MKIEKNRCQIPAPPTGLRGTLLFAFLTCQKHIFVALTPPVQEVSAAPLEDIKVPEHREVLARTRVVV